MSLQAFFWIFIGGGLGSLARFLLSISISKPGSLPLGTLIANILSCLILGYLIGLKIDDRLGDYLVWFLMVGFCGGFSTFSTFSLELFDLLESGNIALFFTYMVASLVLGIIAILIGYKIYGLI